MYNEISDKISSMIPVEWEKVYTMAYIDDGGGEIFLIILNETATN
ncbi:immunity protein YezG family protein [Staphylococcus aureus]